MTNVTGNKPKLSLACSLLDRASLFSETYLNRDRKAGKRPKRIRLTRRMRQARKPGPVLVVDCQNLDLVL